MITNAVAAQAGPREDVDLELDVLQLRRFLQGWSALRVFSPREKTVTTHMRILPKQASQPKLCFLTSFQEEK